MSDTPEMPEPLATLRELIAEISQPLWRLAANARLDDLERRLQEALAEKDTVLRNFSLKEKILDDVITTLEKVRAERDAAREALKFYAAHGSWQDDLLPDAAGKPIPWTAPVWDDEGQRARAALAEKGKP